MTITDSVEREKMILRKSFLTVIVLAWFIFFYFVAFVFRGIFSHRYLWRGAWEDLKEQGNILN